MEMEKSLAYRAALQGNSQQVGDSQKGLGTQCAKGVWSPRARSICSGSMNGREVESHWAVSL